MGCRARLSHGQPRSFAMSIPWKIPALRYRLPMVPPWHWFPVGELPVPARRPRPGVYLRTDIRRTAHRRAWERREGRLCCG
jgi:hypothetical protein